MDTQQYNNPARGRDHGIATEFEREFLSLSKDIKKSIDICLGQVEKEVERELLSLKEKFLLLEKMALHAPNNEIHKKLDRILKNQASESSKAPPPCSYAQIAAQGTHTFPPPSYLPNHPPPPLEQIMAILRP